MALEPLTITQLANMFAMYGVGWTAAFACVALMYQHARRQREPLGLDDLAVYDAGTHARHYAMFVLIGLISVALAVGQVGVRYGVPGHAFMLLGSFCWWNGVHRARGRAVFAAARLPRSAVTPPTTLAR